MTKKMTVGLKDSSKTDPPQLVMNNEEFSSFQLFTAKDQVVVEGFSELLHQTEEREVRINKITKRLNEELMYLSKFLENLATRRPLRKSIFKHDEMPVVYLSDTFLFDYIMINNSLITLSFLMKHSACVQYLGEDNSLFIALLKLKKI